MATVMNEKIKQISEDYINGMIDIMMESLNRQIDAKFEEHFGGKEEVGDPEVFSEERIRTIATEEAENVVDGATINISA